VPFFTTTPLTAAWISFSLIFSLFVFFIRVNLLPEGIVDNALHYQQGSSSRAKVLHKMYVRITNFRAKDSHFFYKHFYNLRAKDFTNIYICWCQMLGQKL